MKDLYHNLSPVVTVKPQTATTDVTGAAVDLAGYEGALVEFVFGQSGDTLSGTVKIAGVIQECDTSDGTFTDVDAAYLLGTLPTVDASAEDETVYSVGYVGAKRYIKANFDLTGTHTNGCPVSATIVRGYPRHAPVA